MCRLWTSQLKTTATTVMGTQRGRIEPYHWKTYPKPYHSVRWYCFIVWCVVCCVVCGSGSRRGQERLATKSWSGSRRKTLAPIEHLHYCAISIVLIYYLA